MPWCEDCERFYNPNTLTSDQSCPEGHPVGSEAAMADGPVRVSRMEAAREAGVPWHFWLLVAALVLYLGWRAVEGVLWVATRLF